MYKALVCGSRSFDDERLMCDVFDNMLPDNFNLISGGAKGADNLAESIAKDSHIGNIIILPDWEKHGKAAGMIRNAEMLKENPDIVIAFWDGKSPGTKNTINGARKLKIPTLIIYY